MNQISENKKISLYKAMLRIRMIEEQIAKYYPLGEMRTPTHFSIGQEAVATGICSVMKSSDLAFASHRSHAPYIARGGCLKQMTAELFGRSTGACKGKGGSAHLSSPENNMYSSPILSGMMPVAVGAAVSFSMDRKRQVAVAFFGDAAVEEGVCAESINFAVVKKLPVLFVCENNLFSTHTHIRYRQPPIPIYKRMRGLGINSNIIDGNDVLKVYASSKECIRQCRNGNGPHFLECVTYRHREHVGPDYDFNNPYRTRKEVESWMRKCPIKRLEKLLISEKLLTIKKIESFKSHISCEIEEAIQYARNSPWPHKKSLLEDVY
jgi:pyruvate dehydrogenase E1 component alpha subunit|tara:strand:- start:1299 stop:2264 length:966 start_codon:yes stop_codon:yes gene_type:complete